MRLQMLVGAAVGSSAVWVSYCLWGAPFDPGFLLGLAWVASWFAALVGASLVAAWSMRR